MMPPEPAHASLIRSPRLNGRYVVARSIGKGAQARVYLAFDARLKQWRAVKVLGENFLDDAHVRARFEQEAQAMARLSHPHLLRVVDVDHDGHTPFMVMELARGGAVTEWMKRNGPVPPILACRIAQQCCLGLGHAHAAGVVHRDVKPHNILIREDGTVAMSDFGIAQIETGASLTATGTIMGTFAFMAPEQRSDAKSVDHRADIYALGATLFTLITGKTSAELFFAESRDDILYRVPEPLRPVILTACRYEREQRYPTMAALYEALERRIAELPRDPAGLPPLTSNLLPLPGGPPDRVEADAGVDELVRALEAPEEQPTMVSTLSTPLPPLDGLLTPVPAPVPYRMPLQGRRRRPTPLSGPSETPSYVDKASATTQRRSPSDRARSKAPEPWGPGPLLRRSLLVGTAAGVLLLALVSTGLAAKVFTSWQLSSAHEALIAAMNEDRQVIIDLAAAGADEEALAQRWFTFVDAPPGEQIAAAESFISLVESEAERLEVQGLALSHVAPLARAHRDYESARLRRQAVADSLISRLTGTIGLY